MKRANTNPVDPEAAGDLQIAPAPTDPTADRDDGEVLLGALAIEAGWLSSDDLEDARMRKLFADHLARTKSQLAYRSCFETLHIRYNEIIADGRSHAEEVNRFLGGGLDAGAMAGVVNPDLYRNRG